MKTYILFSLSLQLHKDEKGKYFNSSFNIRNPKNTNFLHPEQTHHTVLMVMTEIGTKDLYHFSSFSERQ